MKIDSGTANRLDRRGAPLGRPALRIGGIDYLNALPLTAYLHLRGEPELDLKNLVPSALAQDLRQGELDVALVPVVEYLELDDYRIIPDICVSSYGAVESIRLYHRRPLAQVRRVGLDSSSRSSAMLTRLFFRMEWQGAPEFVAIEPLSACAHLDGARSEDRDTKSPSDSPERSDDLDAILLIGDAALYRPAPQGWQSVDLGNEWTRLTGLPFVYAFWVSRASPMPRNLLGRFHEARELGLCHVDDIVRRYVAECAATRRGLPFAAAPEQAGVAWLEESRWRHYLSRVIQYDFGPVQIEGLNRFYALLAEAGLHSRAPRALQFVSACL